MAARSVITIQGMDALKRGLSDLAQTQYPYAMKNALNATAEKILAAEVSLMHSEFISPTPFTLGALKIDYATKTKLEGGVRFKDPTRLSESQHYLYPNVYGGRRGYKKFEAALFAKGLMPARWYAVPGNDAPLDGYGNVPAALIVQILAWFDANTGRGYQGNMTDATRAKRKKGTRKKYGFEYFALRKKSGRMLPGIYKRTQTPFGTAVNSIFIFVPPEHVGYQRIYHFHETGQRIFNAEFKTRFDTELQAALETAFT